MNNVFDDSIISNGGLLLFSKTTVLTQNVKLFAFESFLSRKKNHKIKSVRILLKAFLFVFNYRSSCQILPWCNIQTMKAEGFQLEKQQQ